MIQIDKSPKFPANTGWSVNLSYRPREVTDAIKNMLAETLIRNDNAIRQLLRQCKDKWIFAVTVGQDNMYLKVFDPTEVAKAHQHPISSAINRARTSFFEIDRDLNIRQLSEERVDDVMRTAPMIYADRALKSTEIRTCDAIQRTMMDTNRVCPTLEATIPGLVLRHLPGCRPLPDEDEFRQDFPLDSIDTDNESIS